jgi:hypothetical protein
MVDVKFQVREKGNLGHGETSLVVFQGGRFTAPGGVVKKSRKRLAACLKSASASDQCCRSIASKQRLSSGSIHWSDAIDGATVVAKAAHGLIP